MQRDCDTTAPPRPRRRPRHQPRRRAIGFALVAVLLHLVLPWVHQLQHGAGAPEPGACGAATHACACAKHDADPGAGAPWTAVAPDHAHDHDHDHDAAHCVVCQQFRAGNPLLRGAPPAVVTHRLAVIAAPAAALRTTPRPNPLANAPARGPPLLV